MSLIGQSQEMERNNGFISFLFHGEECVGEVLVAPQDDLPYLQYMFGKAIRVAFFSPSSERCLPLTVLHTIAHNGPWFKMVPTEQQLQTDYHRLNLLYTSCLEESKTAVVELDSGRELHLVAMESRTGIIQHRPCFWAFVTSVGMYASCMGMLNLRCLAMVFDLDETLIVANTMKSFENRIDGLDRKLRGMEMDPQRRSVMAAEMKRYQEDKILLKQYIENDQVFVGNNIVKAQGEVVPPLSEGGLPLIRPIIRLPDRNMVLTRINPSVRDTSVLVRLRPAWEELRSYLNAKGRKRFEVYICTMSERDYALEMWRLLDPESDLVNTRELMQRVICVKSGKKKSLVDVFPQHLCHPRMAMVVDDRLKVWEEMDQPRVHVVPAFAPYYAPQAETNSQIPVLCVARNVACNVRGGFFKHFDEILSVQMSNVHFDTDVAALPSSPDVGNYLTTEVASGPVFELESGLKIFPDTMASPEVDIQLDQASNNSGQVQSFPAGNEEMRFPLSQMVQQPSLTHMVPGNYVSRSLNMESRQEEPEPPFHSKDPPKFSQQGLLRPLGVMRAGSVLGSSPAREEGEVPDSELDPDTRRRLLILQHGMDTKYSRDPMNVDDSTLSGNLMGVIRSYSPSSGWLGLEEGQSPRRQTRASPELFLEPESPSFDGQQQQRLQGPPGFTPIGEGPFIKDRGFRDPRRRLVHEDMFISEARNNGPEGFSQELSSLSDDEEQSLGRNVGGPPDLQLHPGGPGPPNFVSVLEGIAQRLNTVVEYKALLNPSSAELVFKVEALFSGQKVGEGTGGTRKEARYHAAEDALRYLARNIQGGHFSSQPVQQSVGQGSRPGSHLFLRGSEEDSMPARQGPRDPRVPAGLGLGLDLDGTIPSTSAHVNMGDFQRVANNFVSAVKERCTILGVNVNFQHLPSTGTAARKFFHCQVEVAGQILGKGSGLSWDTAKQSAAEEALRHLKPGKRGSMPRSPPIGVKRSRIGLPSSPGRGRAWSSPRRQSPFP